ncbi:unnamed protein product, partial [Closterium sp. NIES-53]
HPPDVHASGLPQQNGIAERRIGMIMDVARTSMIHAAAPHFLWPFAVQYAARQINLQPRVSLPETTPFLRWMGKVGDASVFYVWGSRAFVRDTSADKLSSRAVPSVFLGFPLDAPRCVSYVDSVEPVEVAVDSGAARSAEPAGAGPGRVELGGAEPGGAESGGAEPGVAESEGAELGGAEPERVEPGGAESRGAERGGAEPERAKSGGPPGVPSRREPLSPQRLHEWYTRHCSRAAAGGASGAGAAGGAATARAAGAAGRGGARAAGPGGARTGGTGAAGAGGAAGVGAVGAGAVATGAGDPGAEGTGVVSAVSGGAVWLRQNFVPLLQQVLGLPPSTGPTPPLLSAPPVHSQSQLQRASILSGPSPYSGPTRGLTEQCEPGSRPALPESHPASPESCPESPLRTGQRVPRQRPPPVPGTHSMTLRPSTASQRVPLPSPPASSLPALSGPGSTTTSALIADLVDLAAACHLDYSASLVAESESASVCPPSVGGECALGTDVLEDRQEEFECFAPALPHLVSMLLAPEGDLDAPDIPTPRSYAEAIKGPYSSQWQTAMDTEMASWKSTNTYVDDVPLPGANIVSGMWIFRGSLHEEIWLRRPPGFTGSFPAGTQWSLRRPVYGLRQAPREWHDTLRTTLAALGFAPSTADPSLFLPTDTTLPPFYVLVYVEDLVFATADTEALAHVKSELQKRHTCTDLGPSALRLHVLLATVYSLAYRSLALSSTFGRVPRYVAPDSHRKEHMDAAKRVLRYLCSTSGMGLMLGGRAQVVLTGHAAASWVDDLATQRSSQGYTFSLGSGSVSWRSTRSSSVLSSSCEAEIYARVMAAQELRWLNYVLTDLGEAPRSPPVLYVDNKAMIALCQEHRLEHRMKHIALRYFLTRELQQRGQLCLV